MHYCSPLGSAHLVAHKQHGHAADNSSSAKKFLTCRLRSASTDRIFGGSLHAAVPAQIVVGAVAVVLAIGFVVLSVVRDEIVESEPVMAGHEIDALLGLPLLVTVNVGAARIRAATPGYRSRCRLQETSHIVAEPAVPLLPPVANKADLIESGRIPRLSNQLGTASNGSDSMSQRTGGFGSKRPSSSRDRIEARSNRNPSTCIWDTQ